jgi:hypothetical protein
MSAHHRVKSPLTITEMRTLIVEAVDHLSVRSCLIDGEPEAFLSRPSKWCGYFGGGPFAK